jgi:hypothetical protein
MENHETIATVFAEKLTGYIRGHKFADLIKKVAELAAGFFIGVAILAPGHVIDGLWWMATARNGAILEAIAIMSLFFRRRAISRIFGRLVRFAHKRGIMAAKERLIDGIPISELVDYLIRNGNLKREGANGARETFGLNMDRFNRLANNLERLHILERGENNMRMLAGRWSRQALIDCLGQSESSGSAEPWFRILRIGDPSAKVRLDKEEIATAS